MIFIIDNFLTKEQEDIIENILTDSFFPWFLQKTTIHSNYKAINDTQRFVDFPWLGHIIHNEKGINSNHEYVAKLIIDTLKNKHQFSYKEFARTQINLVFKNEDNRLSPPHNDFIGREDIDTLIYYVNDSDGNTVFYNDETSNTILQEVEPKKGRIVIFPSKITHAGNRPKMNDTRIVINFNMVK